MCAPDKNEHIYRAAEYNYYYYDNRTRSTKKERKKVLSTSNSVNHELNIGPSKLNIRES